MNEIKNVENVTGRYTREFYNFDDFKKVNTLYNLTTRNLEQYLKNKINKAKDITKVFKNLEKDNYTITTVLTNYLGEDCYNTEIAGIFNGNIRTINVLWQNKADWYDRGNCIKDGYKQTICCFIL
jgi:hypothetical protein